MSDSVRQKFAVRTRRLALFAMVGLCFAFAASCDAGQHAETGEIKPAVDGVSANAGSMAARLIRVAYPQAGQYKQGENARLEFVLVNSGSQPDSLVKVSSDAAQRVEFHAGTSTISASPTGTTSPMNSPSPSVTVTTSPTTPATTTATPTGSVSPSTGPTVERLEVPAQASLSALGAGPNVVLVGLNRSLLASQTIKVTFTFDKAGSTTVEVPVAIPASTPPAPVIAPSE